MSAFLVWLRDQIPPTEEGKQQWRQLVTWLDTPPASVLAGAPAALPATSRPAAAPSGAPVTPGAEAAAFDAWMSSER